MYKKLSIQLQFLKGRLGSGELCRKLRISAPTLLKYVQSPEAMRVSTADTISRLFEKEGGVEL